MFQCLPYTACRNGGQRKVTSPRGAASPDAHTQRKLFAAAGGYCQNPECSCELFVDHPKKSFHIAEMAQVFAANDHGPRANAALSEQERGEFGNHRAQSSGPGKPTSAARIRHCPTPSRCSTPTAPRRNAQLLPSGRSLTNVDSISWTIRGGRSADADAARSVQHDRSGVLAISVFRN
jgi:hypothetical protein